jgi:hypothetical protein
MSLVKAEEKFKELIKLVSVAEVHKLKEAYENLKRFAEGEDYRRHLVYGIKEAVKQSVAEAVRSRAITVRDALDMVDDVATYCEMYYDAVVFRADADYLLELILSIIRVLSRNRDYYSWVEDLWVDLQEVIKEVFSG